ncbi:uncharacterized protein YcfJ [Oxalobacteraceae bacterium GrIS 1.18]
MDTETNKFKLHPLLATAAVAVILASAAGIAAMTGLLPNFSKTSETTPAAAVAEVTAPEPASEPAAKPAAEEPAPVAATVPAKKPAVRKAPTVASNYAPKPAQEQNNVPVTPPPPPPPPPCPTCGVVESARVIEQQAPTSGLGAATGAILGGVLGHQVGGGNGKTLATIAGAVGGGFAGNSVEKNTRTSTAYEVIVVMENGSRQRFILKEQRWRPGDAVQINNGQLVPRDQ